MEDALDVLPHTAAIIEKGMAEGLHIGAQVYVSLDGKPVADFGIGESRIGVPMTADSMMLWFSSTKATVAVATAQQWERGKFDLDDHVCEYIPEFGTKGKEAITIRHVLTHTGGFRFADRRREGHQASQNDFWQETIARICDAELEPDWIPGKKAGYHPLSGWFILGELIRRRDGRRLSRYMREEIFEALDMYDSWIGMPPERYRGYGDRIGFMHNTETDTPKPILGWDSEEAVARCVPGGGGRGPMRELGRFYEMLLFRGERGVVRILSPRTVEAVTARHRVRMLDATFQTYPDWGLGFIIDAISYGRHCSARAFGHGGAQSSVGFADPEYGLVVAFVTNGMPGAIRHSQRFEAISTAIYEDLGLAEPGSPGRNHDMPRGGLT